MGKSDLYASLITAYTEANLHRLATRLIEAMRCNQFEFIRKVYKLATGDGEAAEISAHKIFARLIMLYHPDRLQYYQREIEKFHRLGDEAGLRQHANLMVVLENLDKIPLTAEECICAEFADEAPYEYDEDAFDRIVDLEEMEYADDEEDEEDEIDFTSALQYKEYGNLDIAFNCVDLQHTEGELELAGAGITDLAGVEYCRNLTVLDLSDNEILNVTLLGALDRLEELYLAGNNIFFIDSLSFLTRLKRLDLAHNHIEDISALYELPELEYLNLIGNNIAKNQIDYLRRKGVTVIV